MGTPLNKLMLGALLKNWGPKIKYFENLLQTHRNIKISECPLSKFSIYHWWHFKNHPVWMCKLQLLLWYQPQHNFTLRFIYSWKEKPFLKLLEHLFFLYNPWYRNKYSTYIIADKSITPYWSYIKCSQQCESNNNM